MKQNSECKAVKTLIDVWKGLRSHASTLYILDNNVVAFDERMGLEGYAVYHNFQSLDQFVGAYIAVESAADVFKSFKVTKSSVNFGYDDEHNNFSLTIINSESKDAEDNSISIPYITNKNAKETILSKMYSKAIAYENEELSDILTEDDNEFINLGEKFLNDMNANMLCQFEVAGTPVMIAKPFLGNIKKTISIGYRLIFEDKSKVVLKFRQVEKECIIYTYAAFLKLN